MAFVNKNSPCIAKHDDNVFVLHTKELQLETE